MAVIALQEWREATPATVPALRGVYLPTGLEDQALVTRLAKERKIIIREVRAGLAIQTTSFVGSVKIGPIAIQVHPKIEGRAFSVLLGYALGLPHLELLPDHDISLTDPAFQDLLADRLTSEANELISRGLYRHYVSHDRPLSSPRGRILFERLARNGPITSARLPCRTFERDENVLANRVLLSGLLLAAHVAIDATVRSRARRAAAPLAESVRPIALSPSTFRAVSRSASRLTAAYEPAFALIRLLLAGYGVSTTQARLGVELPGFLFDMNLLFQAALGRFLRDWLTDASVTEQYRLADIFRYQPLFNPRRKHAPTPRPDYVMTRSNHIVAIADAKYRDLWERDLPSGMLYQLSVYALSQTDCSVATILYPSATGIARESRIAISDPVTGVKRAHVSLRPVHLARFTELVTSARTSSNDRLRREYAAHLAYGDH